ncbi:hypothetical protein ACHAW5_003767 [Stephanodiscus triporus]|uniref:Exonuclease 1 n=1 Tax=Stephanodiscus triporus TaxID=2934178 RepID=A0ABD3NFP0_9STRA
MGIHGLLRNLHPLLVPPPSHHHGRDDIGIGNEDVGAGVAGSNNGRRHVARGGGGGGGGGASSSSSAVVVRHNVRQFAGKSLAIDASSWLHRAAYSCAERLVESTESGIRDPIAEATYTAYVLDRCNELLVHANVRRIYLVFDGARVPLKSGTNAERDTRRARSLDEARRLKSSGMHVEAGRMYLQCVRGNDVMARVVAHAIERRWGRAAAAAAANDDDDDGNGANGTTTTSTHDDIDDDGPRVRCVWSPYEADAQLVKLCVDGRADAIITEDSDVLVYTAVARAPFPILYKLDRKDGSCDVVTMDWLLDPRYDGGGGCHDNGGAGDYGRRRRRRRRRQLHDDGMSPTSDEVETNDDDYVKKVEYDDAGFAPVRRGLPPLPGPVPSYDRGMGRRRQQQRKQTDGAFLSVLRSIARRERADPGSGVRLFVQACVLSGCDYAPNRLSKVGPVTAFRLAMDASHRDPGERFGRILRNLPAGSGIVVAPGPSTSSGDGDSDDGGGASPGKEDDDDDDNANEDGDPPPPPPPDADRDARAEYEELLSKSEAVFYYHLVRDSSTGNICPLVGHRRSSGGGDDDDDEWDGTAPSPVLEEKFRPRVDVFDAGLTFVGSAAEASTNNPETLPPLAAGDRGRPQQRKGDDGGWMFTTRGHRGGVGLGRVHPPPWKTSAATAPTLTKEPPKETPMQKYLRGMPKTSTGARPSSDKNNPSNTRDAVKSVGSDGRKIDRATGRSPPQISFANVAPRHAAVAPGQRPNPFSSFAYGCANETEEAEEKSPIASSSARATVKEVMKSPFFPSPVTFDYGGTTPLVERKSVAKSRDDADAADTVVAASEAFKPFESAPHGSLDDDDNVKSGNQPKKFATNDVLDNGTSDALFDYGIVLESPRRRTSPTRAGMLREYIDRTFPSDNDRPGPRRVSTSPPEGSRSDLFHSGNSPGDVIDLVDDEEAESLPVASSTVKENVPNCGRRNVKNATSSSVIRRKFKSPYLATTPKQMAASSSLGINKARPTTSSSALLAGFARQKETCPASSSSGSGSVTKRKSKPNFFPTKTMDNSSQGRLKKAKWSDRWGFAAPV